MYLTRLNSDIYGFNQSLVVCWGYRSCVNWEIPLKLLQKCCHGGGHWTCYSRKLTYISISECYYIFVVLMILSKSCMKTLVDHVLMYLYNVIVFLCVVWLLLYYSQVVFQ